MSSHSQNSPGPRGGLRAGDSATRAWRWERGRQRLISAPVRCKRDQWYLARGITVDGARLTHAELALRFLHDRNELAQRTLTLHARNGHAHEVLGWIQTPENATHLQIVLTPAVAADGLVEMTLHPVAERDPKCHPLANIPRWSTYQPPFPIDRLLLPPLLESLAEVAPELAADHLWPHSRAQLVNSLSGRACVLDPAWVDDLGLTWEDILRLGGDAWLILDLETAGKLLSRAGLTGLELFTARSEHGIMSARVEYADVETRGFALQDVFPYGSVMPDGSFELRALRANRAWRRLADELALATLLASETPGSGQTGHVLSAAAPLGRGELVITDLPWLVAGKMGPLLAPRLARHALRMHLAAPLADDLQYWNRWDDSQILVRDICDLARRYPPLQMARWAPSADGHARLGLVLPARSSTGSVRTVLIRTGRIDNLVPHAGLPPEPMMIAMKQLAREAREATGWAQRCLADVNVTWQFDTAAGVRYAANYQAAESFATGAIRSFRLQTQTGQPDVQAWRAPSDRCQVAPLRSSGLDSEQVVALTEDEGIFGDSSLDYLNRLLTRLRGWIEHDVRPT